MPTRLKQRLEYLAAIADLCHADLVAAQKFQRIGSLLLELISAKDLGLVVESQDGVNIYTASGHSARQLSTLLPTAAGLIAPALLPAGADLPPNLRLDYPDLKNILVVPLPCHEQVNGLLALVNYPGRQLHESDVSFLKIIAAQLALHLQVQEANLVEKDNQRLDNELSITGQIQDSFLPTRMPDVAGLDFAARLKPAHHVGGDFYDVFSVPDGLAIIIGDVAGKGVPAALLSALIHATLKSEVQHHYEPAELLQNINHLIYEELDRTHTFITAFLAILQTNPLGLRYASAGHTVTLLWTASSQDVLPLTSTGLPLGVTPEVQIGQKELRLDPGDVLLLYTDGITEAENEQGRVFGMQAMIDLLVAAHTAPADRQIGVILDGLDLHRGSRPLSDDVAIFLARVEDRQEIPARVIPFVYPAVNASARSLAIFSRHTAEQLDLPDTPARRRFLEEWELAVSEIATNILRHAYLSNPYHGRIQGRISVWPKRVRLDLIDSGMGYYPKPPPPFFAHNPPESGYGMIIAHKLLDECRYTRLPSGRNHWRLEKLPEGKTSGVSHAD